MQPIQKRYAAHPETFLMTRPAHPEMIANHTCNKDTPCCTPSRGGCARVTPWVHPPPLTSLRRTSLRKVAGWLSRPTQVLGVGTNGAVGRVFSRPEQPIQKRFQTISATRTPLAWLHPPPLTSLRSHFWLNAEVCETPQDLRCSSYSATRISVGLERPHCQSQKWRAPRYVPPCRHQSGPQPPERHHHAIWAAVD